RIVGAVYDRPRCSSCEIVGGHRPPLQFGCFAPSVTYWAHHDFTDQTVLPGEIRTSDITWPGAGDEGLHRFGGNSRDHTDGCSSRCRSKNPHTSRRSACPALREGTD